MILGTVMLLMGIFGFSILFGVLLFRGRSPRVTTITRIARSKRDALTHSQSSDLTEK